VSQALYIITLFVIGCLSIFLFWRQKIFSKKSRVPKPSIKLAYQHRDEKNPPLYYNLTYERVLPMPGSVLGFYFTEPDCTLESHVILTVESVRREIDLEDTGVVWIIKVYSDGQDLHDLIQATGWYHELSVPLDTSNYHQL
jgi:hypothetical protein